MSEHTNINCEEALLMMSRYLDGDLNKGEIGQIHHHAIHCAECQKQMEEMAAVELDLAAFNESYEAHSLDNRFNVKIKTSIALQEQKEIRISLWQRLQEKFDIKPLTDSRLFPMAIGAMASFLIFAIVWPQLQSDPDPIQSPITLVEAPFEQAQGAKWTHEKTIPPGQSLEIVVQQDGGKVYLLRMSSNGPAKMNVRRSNQNLQEVFPQNMTLDGLLYGTINASKINGGVMIQNQGNVPIKLNAHSHNLKAIQMILKNKTFR